MNLLLTFHLIFLLTTLSLFFFSWLLKLVICVFLGIWLIHLLCLIHGINLLINFIAILLISVGSMLSFLILATYVFSIFFFVNRAKSLSILLILANNWLLVSFIFPTVCQFLILLVYSLICIIFFFLLTLGLLWFDYWFLDLLCFVINIKDKTLPPSLVCVCARSLQSCLTLCDSMDYIAHQAPLTMGFSRQEYWSGLPSLFQGIFLTQGIKLLSPELKADSLLLSHWRSPKSCFSRFRLWFHFYLIQVFKNISLWFLLWLRIIWIYLM